MTQQNPSNSRLDVVLAHTFSTNNRNSLLNSEKCGCFYCLKSYSPTEITLWVDENNEGIGQTALCPYCSIDAVISSNDVQFDDNFLAKMNAQWF